MELNITNISSVSNEFINNQSMFSLEKRIKFFLFLILQAPSLGCTILILYHFNWSRIQSQIYGLLLIVNAFIIGVELPFTLYFLYEGNIYTKKICTPWITLNYSLSLLSICLMAWTSIERYLFIYYERIIMRHNMLLHYIPNALIIFYCPFFYIGVVVIHTCQPVYDINQYLCGGACYQFECTLGLFDWIGNGICIVMITFILTILLIIRHVLTRHRMKSIITIARRKEWRRSLKLSLQLLAIAMPYMIAWIPYSVIVLVQIFHYNEQLAYILSTYIGFLPYLQAFMLPHICLLFIPEIKKKIFTILNIPYCRQRRIEAIA
ncbi:unnamed protein product [Rotaria sp. Silwood1]|nr:unnamed protein product [Rotaria sp. Silwood1]CAF3491990.1 unnamed protein product [Rotaria sp. Silwood1]CAF3525091.1 unnamed protein product [Rotaria sp. Silwood1]CAF4591065.1 unnamed protein product [Rotaria sp. Silwood1]